MAFGKLEAAAAASTRPIDGGRRLHVQLWSACIAQPQSDLPGTTNTVGLMRSHLSATTHHPTFSRHPSPQTLRSLSALLRQLRHHHSVTPLRPQPQSPSDLTLSPLSHSLPPSPPPHFAMAFVGSAVAFPAAGRPTSAAAVSARTSTFTAPLSLATPATTRHGVPTMMVGEDPKRKFGKIARDADAKINAQSNRPQGWTRFSEVVNGRGAMIGFAAGLVVELATGQSIYSQVAALGSLPAELVSKVF